MTNARNELWPEWHPVREVLQIFCGFARFEPNFSVLSLQ